MSDRCQHRRWIYHFTINRELLSSHSHRCCKEPSAIGAVPVSFVNDDLRICADTPPIFTSTTLSLYKYYKIKTDNYKLINGGEIIFCLGSCKSCESQQ